MKEADGVFIPESTEELDELVGARKKVRVSPNPNCQRIMQLLKNIKVSFEKQEDGLIL